MRHSRPTAGRWPTGLRRRAGRAPGIVAKELLARAGPRPPSPAQRLAEPVAEQRPGERVDDPGHQHAVQPAAGVGGRHEVEAAREHRVEQGAQPGRDRLAGAAPRAARRRAPTLWAQLRRGGAVRRRARTRWSRGAAARPPRRRRARSPEAPRRADRSTGAPPSAARPGRPGPAPTAATGPPRSPRAGPRPRGRPPPPARRRPRLPGRARARRQGNRFRPRLTRALCGAATSPGRARAGQEGRGGPGGLPEARAGGEAAGGPRGGGDWPEWPRSASYTPRRRPQT